MVNTKNRAFLSMIVYTIYEVMYMPTTLGDHLRQLRESKRLSLREVATRTNGVLSHSAVAQAESGKNSHGKTLVPSPATLKALAAVYNVSYVDLMVRAGYIPKKITIKTDGKSQEVGDDMPSMQPTESPEIPVANAFIPVYGEIHAGDAAYAEENIIGQVPVPQEYIERYGKENLFALRIDGDSMNRRIPNGFAAVFEKDREPINGDIVAVRLDDEDAMAKVYENTSKAIIFKPNSYDPTYQAYVFPKDTDEPQNFEIIGVYLFSTDIDI